MLKGLTLIFGFSLSVTAFAETFHLPHRFMLGLGGPAQMGVATREGVRTEAYDPHHQDVILEGSFESITTELLSLQDSGAPECGKALVSCQGELCRQVISDCFSQPMLSSLNQRFPVAGPNCFATALRILNLTPSFRGLDAPEMQAFDQAFCQTVETPRYGDIGIYESPGFGMAHAFVFINPRWGIEKPGVDYLGKTPIQLRSLVSIDYRSRASYECRRYSPDPSVCSNSLRYVRCTRPENHAAFSDHAGQSQDIVTAKARQRKLLNSLRVIDENLELLISKEKFQTAERKLYGLLRLEVDARLRALIREESQFQPEIFRYFVTRLSSQRKQLEFLSRLNL